MKTNRPKSNRAFTLVETLVAIAVLMIAIAGPLTVANKGYTSALDARNETIANSLAQEGLEYLSNYKDNNLVNGSWPPPGLSNCLIGSVCAVSSVDGDPINSPGANIGPCTSFNNCELELSDAHGYSYNYLGTATPFSRYFYITNMPSDPYTGQLLATVVVKWSTGPVMNQVQLQEVLTNAIRY